MNNTTSENQKSTIKNQKSMRPGRRMRRSKRVAVDVRRLTSSTPETLETSIVSPDAASPANQKSDIINQKSPASSPNQKSAIRNHKLRAQPFKPLPEFAALNPDQLEYIHDLLRTRTLAEAQQEIWADLHVRIHTSKLHRYKHKLDLADLLHVAEDSVTAIDELNNLFAGRATELSEAGLLVVQQRALALASSPTTSPSLLKDLFRIFTFEHRRALDEQRLQIAAQREATRAQLAAHRIHIDTERLKLAQQKQAHFEKLNEPEKPFNQSELTERINNLLAAGAALSRNESVPPATPPNTAPINPAYPIGGNPLPSIDPTPSPDEPPTANETPLQASHLNPPDQDMPLEENDEQNPLIPEQPSNE